MAGFYRKLIPKLYFLSERMTLFPTCSFELYDIEKTPLKILRNNAVNVPSSAAIWSLHQWVTGGCQYAFGAALAKVIDGISIILGSYSRVARGLFSSASLSLLWSAFHSLNTAKSNCQHQQQHMSILTVYISDVSHIKASQNI